MDFDTKEPSGLHISNDYLRDLECPICLQIPTEVPIYQCDKGHIHCKDCHPSLKECPVCRSKQFDIRSLMTEKLILKIPKDCQFSTNGCPIKLEKSKLGEHEKNCLFKIVPCGKCGGDFLQFNLADHSQVCQYQNIKCKYSHWGCKQEFKPNQSSLQPNEIISRHEQMCQYEPQNCRWLTNGCQIKLPMVQLMDHQLECKFTPIQCMYCNQRQTSFDISSHFQDTHYLTVHHDKVTYKLPQSGRIQQGSNLPSKHIQAKSHQFVVYNTSDNTNAYTWVYILGNRKDIDKFSCSIKIFSKEKNMSLQYKGPIDTSFSIYSGHLTQMADQNGECDIEVEIVPKQETIVID